MSQQPVSCAVYTRKSTSEGLDQQFSSLDAQRESAQSYIASQKSQGWVALPESYDDGGYTGANMDRPALARLLRDIEAGRVHCVVVYKVDRLSRSLLDFVKMLEFFDKHQVAFVSVTQHFNTQNSMGRLTLNILLSFAQFEREIISERTRDKMGAARKKGRWMGGMAMLGYDVDPKMKRLVVNPEEAKLVRLIFDLYIRHRSLQDVADDLNARGLRSKKYNFTREGKAFGGNLFNSTSIRNIVGNAVYAGKVRHHGALYQGEQEAIVAQDLFDIAQRILAENRVHRILSRNVKDASLLRGLLWCAHCGNPMAATYAGAGNGKWAYYLCRASRTGKPAACPAKSVSQNELNAAVVAKLRQIAAGEPYREQNLVIDKPAWENLSPPLRRRVLLLIIKRIEVASADGKVAIEMNDEGIADLQKELCVTNSPSS